VLRRRGSPPKREDPSLLSPRKRLVVAAKGTRPEGGKKRKAKTKLFPEENHEELHKETGSRGDSKNLL